MVGELLDNKYRLLRVLGRGAMGLVYEARHVRTSRRVAVKLIDCHLLVAGRRAKSRFRREARAAGAIESPHIVQILDSGADERTGDLYLVMEYLEGEDLERLIDRVGPLPPEVALRVAAQALDGLRRAHESGVVHRDVKPANIFLARVGDGEVVVKLLDFGIAKVQSGATDGPHTTNLTAGGGILGSPLYMSPEQVRSSRDAGPRSDLWSLASALYCALAGHPPHRGPTSMGGLFVAICTTPPPPLAEAAPWIPPELAAAVHGALALDPGDRYPSASAMLEALRALLPGGVGLREEMLVGLFPLTHPAVSRRAAPPSAGSTQDAEGRTETTEASAHERTLTLRETTPRGPDPVGASSGLRPAEPGSAPSLTSRRPLAAMALAAAVTALVLALAASPRSGRPPTPDEPALDRTTAEPITVRLVVLPEDVSAQVDGRPAAVQDGEVELSGRVGSTCEVVLSKDGRDSTTLVRIGERGPVPAKVRFLPIRPQDQP